MQFADFKFNATLSAGLDAMGFKNPTPIQEQAIPVILANEDLIACAQTGTGKTAAFVLPILHKISEEGCQTINTLILAPTRELALQIDQQIEGFSYFLGISSIAVYGGGSGDTFQSQKNALEQGSEIVIATPGRLIALITSDKVSFKDLKHLILDEADRMLDMGFHDDIMRIISHLPKERQTILFSATMPENIRKLANKILNKPKQINIATSKPAVGIKQIAYYVNEDNKQQALMDILAKVEFESIIIFAGTKDTTKKLERVLKRAGQQISSFHSDLEQNERIEIINQFKSKKLRTLIGTDILSRGIDIDGIDLVINYDIPSNPADYIHRIGRTARGDKEGTAIAIINQADQRKFKRIEALIEKQVERVNLTGAEIPLKPAFVPSDKTKKPFKKKFVHKVAK